MFNIALSVKKFEKGEAQWRKYKSLSCFFAVFSTVFAKKIVMNRSARTRIICIKGKRGKENGT
jgi:hypothetical protein